MFEMCVASVHAMAHRPLWDMAHELALLVDGKVLVVGGTNDLGTYYASAELYDPAAGSWSVTGSMSVARAYFPAVLLPASHVLVVGGQNSGGVLSSADIYTP